MSNTTNKEQTAYTNDKEFEKAFEAFLEHPFKDLYQDTMLLNSMREAAEFGRKYALQLSAHCKDKDEWVSVENSLPENTGKYNVTVQSRGDCFVDTVMFAKDWEVWNLYGSLITHWQPLPKPPIK